MSSIIPKHLAIEVLYADDSIVVINKPNHLRSVPGHANSPPTIGKRKREPEQEEESAPEAPTTKRQTAQEAWMGAILSFAQENSSNSPGGGTGGASDEKDVHNFLHRLSLFSKNGIPRKKKLFTKFAQRNCQKLFDGPQEEVEVDKITSVAFDLIKERQLPLLNLPERTKDEESAEGQLKLLGFEDLRKQSNCDDVASAQGNDKQQTDSKIRVVHRLDMETSGLIVYARTEEAASKLCELWRNRNDVKKYYLARVARWDPYHKYGEESGTIELALAPSDERLKWKVTKEEDGGKPSKTIWSLYGPQGQKESDSEATTPVTLELQPVTGRTHQLRIHCAEMGSGIDGDTLYGDNPIPWDGRAESADHTLCLHAHKLIFPHPKTGERMEFTTAPKWQLL